MAEDKLHCEHHGEFMATLQVLAKANADKDAQMKSITDKLDKIHTALTRNLVKAEFRDKKQAEFELKIDEINRKIENGLRGELREVRAIVDAQAAALAKDKQDKIDRKKDDEKGMKGALRRGCLWIVEKGTVIVLLVVAWLVAKVIAGGHVSWLLDCFK